LMRLFDQQGSRSYLTEEEWQAFLEAASKGLRQARSFSALLDYTGCRLSEPLALGSYHVDLSGKVSVFECLKKRPATRPTLRYTSVMNP
jgi:integrase/recombinase XerD